MKRENQKHRFDVRSSVGGGAFAKAAEIAQKSHSYRFPILCSISIEQTLVNHGAVGSNPAGGPSFPAIDGVSSAIRFFCRGFPDSTWLNLGLTLSPGRRDLVGYDWRT
jgi:hypothetical protein